MAISPSMNSEIAWSVFANAKSFVWWMVSSHTDRIASCTGKKLLDRRQSSSTSSWNPLGHG